MSKDGKEASPTGITQAHVDDIWKCCDMNNDNKVTFEEFFEGFNNYLKSQNQPSVHWNECKAMFCGLIQSNNIRDTFTKDELERELMKRKPRCEGLKEQFKKFAAKDGKPNISRQELKEITEESGVINAEDIENFVDEVFRLADKDGNGEIDVDEYAVVMDKLSH